MNPYLEGFTRMADIIPSVVERRRERKRKAEETETRRRERERKQAASELEVFGAPAEAVGEGAEYEAQVQAGPFARTQEAADFGKRVAGPAGEPVPISSLPGLSEEEAREASRAFAGYAAGPGGRGPGYPEFTREQMVKRGQAQRFEKRMARKEPPPGDVVYERGKFYEPPKPGQRVKMGTRAYRDYELPVLKEMVKPLEAKRKRMEDLTPEEQRKYDAIQEALASKSLTFQEELKAQKEKTAETKGMVEELEELRKNKGKGGWRWPWQKQMFRKPGPPEIREIHYTPPSR